MHEIQRKTAEVLSHLWIPGFHQLPPGFIQGTEKGTYQVDPNYINAHRSTLEMPVNPDYDILDHVAVLGMPRMVVHVEVAANPRNESLPTLTQLTDNQYYRITYLPDHIGSSGMDYGSRERQIPGPIEMRPFATNIFIFPVVEVQYTYAVQSIHEQSAFEIKGTAARPFRRGKIHAGELLDDTFRGLAYVSHLRIPVNLKTFFQSPKEIEEFNGYVPFSGNLSGEQNIVADGIFHTLFKNRLEHMGNLLSELRKEPVKGVILSPISAEYKYADNIMTGFAPDPQGEFVIAASFLV